MPTNPIWHRFVLSVRQNSPQSPVTLSNSAQQTRSSVATAASAGTALLDGMGVPIPAAVGPATAVGTANGARDLQDAAVDTAVSGAAGAFSEGAGLFVGNGLSVLRGAFRAVERSDRIENYLNQLGGYVDGLARCSIDALFSSAPYATIPTPPIPAYANNMGRLYSARTRGSWIRGHRRVGNVIRNMDALRPTHGNHYSKWAFVQLALNSGGQVTRRAHTMRLRMAIEDYIVRRILFVDMFRRATQLRRWGNTG